MKKGMRNWSCVLVVAIFFAVHGEAQSVQPIYQSDVYTVWPDRVIEGKSIARAISRTEIESNYSVQGDTVIPAGKWALKEDLQSYPRMESQAPLLDALYNLSLEELKHNLRPDGALSAGAKWQGVWTRDVSYSVLLALAAIEPEASRKSLLAKVKRDRIVQDTGTGGSWPVSSDRVCWGLAAWEIYLVTGDRQWLEHSFSIVENSIRDDEKVVIDPGTGLARGESSFLDWREQTYPKWMQPADIYSSENLGTNAVYYRVYRILAMMAGELGQPSSEWAAKADRIRSAINSHLWIESEGLYGQYLYGRSSLALSPRSDALGQSLAILFDVADAKRQDSILQAQPLMTYGIPTVYPQAPEMRPYHNQSVWPFVQAFWTLAGAKRGDREIVSYGIASILRASALFLTNKENFVVDTGSPAGTAINSDRQLWSVAGNLAMTYRILFGMEFTAEGLTLHPVIPRVLEGTRTLTNFHYREATLSITVHGSGDQVESVLLDGKASSPLLSVLLKGEHAVVIKMAAGKSEGAPLHIVKNAVAPDTPVVMVHDKKLTWNAVPQAKQYAIYSNGRQFSSTTGTEFNLQEAAGRPETVYQVASIGDDGTKSFLSEPVPFPAAHAEFAIRSSANESTPAFVEIDQTGTTGVTSEGAISEKGIYYLVFRYANGSGPISTDNKCAIRTLFIDDKEVGPIVLPQRGLGQWDASGLSSGQSVQLDRGHHKFELRFLPSDLNMNGEINRARVFAVVLAKAGR